MTDLRKLLDAATKGPWTSTRTDPAEGYDCCWLTASPNGRNSETELGSIAIPANAALIVAAVNALPDLLDVVEAAKSLIDGYQAGMSADEESGRVDDIRLALAQWEKRK